jgi:hypothetical protein
MCLLISWNIHNICSIYITLLLEITDRFCGTIGFVDTSISSNLA